MKKLGLLVCLLMFASFASAKEKAKKMSITSASWQNDEDITGDFVFKGMGCEGKNQSPEVSWKDLPKNAKSIAVTVYDPDAPTGSGWWHWIIYNIPVTMTGLPQGFGEMGKRKLKGGPIQNMTDFGDVGYGGPCPPQGDSPHHYFLKVFALDVEKLDIPDKASGAMAGFYINQHIVAEAGLTGFYAREGYGSMIQKHDSEKK